jgi:paraquat-inducible protein B
MVELQAALDKFLKKLDSLPLAEIIGEMRQTVQSLDAALKSAEATSTRVNAEILPELKATLEETRKTLGAAKQTLSADAPLQSDLRNTLRDLSRAAQSLRVFTDYLERNPEALLRGKEGDKP